jgi:hypothetical protein
MDTTTTILTQQHQEQAAADGEESGEAYTEDAVWGDQKDQLLSELAPREAVQALRQDAASWLVAGDWTWGGDEPEYAVDYGEDADAARREYRALLRRAEADVWIALADELDDE